MQHWQLGRKLELEVTGRKLDVARLTGLGEANRQIGDGGAGGGQERPDEPRWNRQITNGELIDGAVIERGDGGH